MNQDPRVEVMVAQELLPELAEDISHIDLLVFLDARAGGVPGSVEVSEVKPAQLASGVFIHTLTMETLLSNAESLFGHAPKAMLISWQVRALNSVLTCLPTSKRLCRCYWNGLSK